jgi:formiminoglutamase
MNLKLIETSDLERLTDPRSGETKIGESIKAGSDVILENLSDSTATFVVLGVPENVGPRANCGRGGSESAWEAFLPKFLNIQETDKIQGWNILLLGSIDCNELNALPSDDLNGLRKAVESIDYLVSELVQLIVSAGKIPIIIGGGHNNSYGAIKGSSQALNQAINCINLDPHADYRIAEGRHSGNGFSYAKNEGYLAEYAVVAMHENYNSTAMLQQMKKDGVHHLFFEDIFLRNKIDYKSGVEQLLDLIKDQYYGVELDCDAIQDFPSSAQSPSGVSANEARQYVSLAANSKNVVYFHLPEAAPTLVEGSAPQVGKLLAYLVSDFVKARNI